MNRQRAKELLPIIQAFAEGKEIQFRDRGSLIKKWSDGWPRGETSWGFMDHFEYRIKPELREFWAAVPKDGYVGAMCASKEALECMGEDAIDWTSEYIKVREVIE